MRAVWPDTLPLTARFGVLEFDGRDEETIQEAITLTRQWREGGLDLLSVSIGFSTPDASIPWGTAFLAPVAERVRREAQIPVASAWGIDSPSVANETIEKGELDLVMVGRAHLKNPHWPYQAALALDKSDPSWVLPAPYAHWLERYRVGEA